MLRPRMLSLTKMSAWASHGRLSPDMRVWHSRPGPVETAGREALGSPQSARLGPAAEDPGFPDASAEHNHHRQRRKRAKLRGAPSAVPFGHEACRFSGSRCLCGGNHNIGRQWVTPKWLTQAEHPCATTIRRGALTVAPCISPEAILDDRFGSDG